MGRATISFHEHKRLVGYAIKKIRATARKPLPAPPWDTLFNGGFYKLALSDFVALFEVIVSVSEGV